MSFETTDIKLQVSKYERKIRWMAKEEKTRIRINRYNQIFISYILVIHTQSTFFFFSCRFLDNSQAGLILDVLEAVIALIYALSYVANTYSAELEVLLKLSYHVFNTMFISIFFGLFFFTYIACTNIVENWTYMCFFISWGFYL